jgi:diguanylate cyclase (GGDEF)-like protein
MTRWFEDAPIRWKLTVLMAGTAAFALMLASLAFGTAGIVSFRRSLDQKLDVVADVVGRNCTAALAFQDRSAARDVLAALAAEPSIQAGAVFDRDGHPFASYVSGDQPGAVPATLAGITRGGMWGPVRVVHPIILDGEQVGAVYLQSTGSEVTSRIETFAGLILAVVVMCGVVALLASAGLQSRISKPILDLAHTARLVTSDRNFGLRASPAGGDEVGVLVQDFNRMLVEIERQDRQLRQQQESLTEEVAHRTDELVRANSQLTSSVARVEHYAGQIAQLTALVQLLQSCVTPDEVFDVMQDAIPRLFPDDSGAVTILESSGKVMEVMATWGHNPPQQRVFGPDECWAFRRGRAHFVGDAGSPLRCTHLTEHDGPATFCVPMIAQGDNVGILQFNFAGSDADEGRDGSEPHSTRTRLATALAEQAALALANLRLREALKSQSIVDPLTGLYNRRYLENVLERECRRAVRAKRNLTVLMIDVDHFKQFNDTWGHEGGDVVLRELASLMRTHFRGDDIACRYGGEEFIVVLAEATMDAAFTRAEELRAGVQRLVAEYRQRPLGSITVSIGIASLPEHGTLPQELIGAADRALYEAKSAGRGKTVCASPPDGLPRPGEAGGA